MTKIDNVCVVIPAYFAEATIGPAVESALIQKEVSSVFVVDDCSHDETVAAARHAAKGDPRLTVIERSANGGPARARNMAIAASTGDYIALLDSDDLFVANRFSHITPDGLFDLIADNIAFVSDQTELNEAFYADLERGDPACSVVTLAEMIEGNISRPGKPRAELGFLKPIMSRDFLQRNNLHYNTDLRLGEDFDLYLRMLAGGAVFLTSKSVGYVARVRQDSLSGSHSGRDLEALYHAVYETRAAYLMTNEASLSLDRYLTQLRQRYLIHRFLEVKKEDGYARAAAYGAIPFSRMWPIATAIFQDKFGKRTTLQPCPAIRYLFKP